MNRSRAALPSPPRHEPAVRLVLQTSIVARVLGVRLLVLDGAFYVPHEAAPVPGRSGDSVDDGVDGRGRSLGSWSRPAGRNLSDARQQLREGAALLAQARPAGS